MNPEYTRTLSQRHFCYTFNKHVVSNFCKACVKVQLVILERIVRSFDYIAMHIPSECIFFFVSRNLHKCIYNSMPSVILGILKHDENL